MGSKHFLIGRERDASGQPPDVEFPPSTEDVSEPEPPAVDEVAGVEPPSLEEPPFSVEPSDSIGVGAGLSVDGPSPSVDSTRGVP